MPATPSVVDWDEREGRLVQIASKMTGCVKRQRKANKQTRKVLEH